MAEAGATAVQEIAFTLSNAIAYVQAAVDAGLAVDAFRAPAGLLLRGPDDPVRGGGQVPGDPAASGPRPWPRGSGAEAAFADAAVPHPDGRGQLTL